MARTERSPFFTRGILVGGIIFGLIGIFMDVNAQNMPKLLTDPFLQLPTADSVEVVWFTAWEGGEHRVNYGEQLEHRAIATTHRLSRTQEDAQSHIPQPPPHLTMRPIWRHQATISGLKPDQQVPYRVVSDYSPQASVKSDVFRLTPLPSRDRPLKILLTSDHQLMPMVAANLQKVQARVGQIDAVFFAGDLVNIPDRASEWFDDSRGGGFFPCLQGKAHYALTKAGQAEVYAGAQILQNAPLFPAIGNHEVMGRFSETLPLNQQFKDAFPRDRLPINFQTSNANELTKVIKDSSFNSDIYEEIFSLPVNSEGNSRYYALTYGNIRLIVLYVTNIWRSPDLDPLTQGRYQESEKDLDYPERWGYGQHIFESIQPDSPQYRWLQSELASPEFSQAPYKIVMFHHPPHTLGGNIVPAYTDPVQSITSDERGKIVSIRYDYPIENDYIIRDLMPLLEKARVNLVFYGHSHLWNRFISPTGINFLESSNVGNSYGAHLDGKPRPIPGDRSSFDYVPYGDPNGLEPIMPSLSPIKDELGSNLPYIASNDITVFSVLDTRSGTVSSYRFDTRYPQSEVIKFDEFSLDLPEDGG